MIWNTIKANARISQLEDVVKQLTTDKEDLLSKLNSAEGVKTQAEEALASQMTVKSEYEAKLNEELAKAKKEFEGTLQSKESAFAAKQKELEESFAIATKAHAEAIEKLTTDFKAQLSDSEEKLKKSENSANAKAAELMASLGVAPDEGPKISKGDLAATPEAKLSHFKTLSGVEKAEYYKNNRRDILHASNELVNKQ